MSENSSNSSGGKSGNTKQISPSKHWCFTLNGYTKEDIDMFINTNKDIVPKYIFQEEIGESGNHHLQGYLMFATKKRPKSVFENNRIHWEKCKSIKKSILYCSKKDTRKEGCKPYTREIIIKEPYDISIKLYKWEVKIDKILKTKPDDRTLYWVWEEKGCAGKTTFQKWIYLNHDRVVVLSGKATDMKNGIIEYQKKNGCLPSIVLINIPRTSRDYISYAGIEDIKDMFFYSGKYEGGMVCGPNPHVFIFSNDEPEYEKVSLDRWKTIYIGNKK